MSVRFLKGLWIDSWEYTDGVVKEKHNTEQKDINNFFAHAEV